MTNSTTLYLKDIFTQVVTKIPKKLLPKVFIQTENFKCVNSKDVSDLLKAEPKLLGSEIIASFKTPIFIAVIEGIFNNTFESKGVNFHLTENDFNTCANPEIIQQETLENTMFTCLVQKLQAIATDSTKIVGYLFNDNTTIGEYNPEKQNQTIEEACLEFVGNTIETEQ